jgi:thiol-disulfide isomerase/thioredoxin
LQNRRIGLKRSSRNINLIFILAIFLLPAIILTSPAIAQVPTAQPLVKAVLFWMDGCPHCHTVLDEVLPSLQEKYGSQLEIHLIEVVTTEDIELAAEIIVRAVKRIKDF